MLSIGPMLGMRSRPRFVVLTVAAVLLMAGVAQAQTYTVTNLSDSGVAGDGSLRGEVLAANANVSAEPDTIAFASGLTGTIGLGGSGLVISDPLDLEGPGPGQVTVAQSSPHRVFDIDLASPGGAVTIGGLHIDAGTAPSSGPNEGAGGDILSANADLRVVNDLVTGGNAVDGGGIDSLRGPLTLRSSTISGNRAQAYAGVSAGGVFDFTIQASTISGNVASGPDGGLAAQTEGSGLIESSTISGNVAEDEPGVNLNVVEDGRVTVRNSTLSGNTATDGGGGGLFIITSATGSVAIEDTTIADNHVNGASEGEGGGIQLFGKNISIENTIVAGNTASVAGPDVSGSSLSSAFSLVGNTAGVTIAETVPGSDLLGVDPQLGPLQDNGGPTSTMALTATSPAVNKGAGALGVDQRGQTRPVAFPGVANSTAAGANGADIGAVELQAPAPVPASNRFSFGKVKLNRKKGTATVQVNVPDAGVVLLAGTKKVKKATKGAQGTVTLKLTVRARGKALKALKKKGAAKVTAMFTFTPTGGTAASRSKTLRLIKERPGSRAKKS